MKKGAVVLAVLCLAVLLSPMALAEGAEKPRGPVYAGALEEGSYDITVRSRSPMFRVISGRLTVKGDRMEVCMALDNTEYGKLFMGTGEEARTAPDTACIYYRENGRGEYTYTVPVEALDQETDCAAWSIQGQTWHDQTLVFESDGLPEDAYAKPAMLELVSPADAMVIVGALAVIFLLRHKPVKKRK